MELNRHHYFMIGLVILFIGLQVRFVQTYVLTDDAAAFIAKRFEKNTTPSVEAPFGGRFRAATAAMGTPAARRSFQPPPWLGWATISIGAVLILHSLAMPRPS